MTDEREASIEADNLGEPAVPWAAALPMASDDGPGAHATEVVEPTVELSGASTSRATKNPTSKRRFIEWIVVIVFAVLVAGGLRTFVVQAFFVPSGSMLPTLQIGDRIVVIKFGYTIHRGDIVVFTRPPQDVGTQDKDLVKRVIGLPGETISSRGNTVLINARPLKEPWLPRLTGVCAENAENIRVTKIPPGHYFVMGDCRGDSADSRVWGTLPGSLVVGRVVVIVWRFGHPYFHWF